MCRRASASWKACSPRSEVLAAVLTYRAFYYLLPLLVALLVFLTLEMRRRPPTAMQATPDVARDQNR